MKVLKAKFLFVCAFALLIGWASVALGDWDEGDPHKMHYPQLPKALEGWDVALFSEGSIWLADDWECTETGPVSDIHFWVSWHYDDVQPLDGLSIRIYSDDPCGINGWSVPDVVLWERDFFTPDITVREMIPESQGWFDPYWDEWEYSDHNQWAQVNITDIPAPFIQQEGEVYWLMIDVWSGGNIGWKQSGSQQFRDDAVYFDGLNWIELKDPDTWDSMDLAFVITGGEEEGAIKWEQPPCLDDPIMCMDVHATEDDWIWFEPQVLADDFLCTKTGLITDIHVWGSWFSDEPPDNDPNHVWFTLCLYSDDPCGPSGWSEPNELLWTKEFQEGEFDVEMFAEGPEGFYSPLEGIYEPDSDWTCWLYNFYIDPCDAFVQEEGTIYWLAVQAHIGFEPEETRFGWKNSSEQWNDDAVWTRGLLPYDLMNPWEELRHPVTDESMDLAFKITTIEMEEPAIKWEQLPDPCVGGYHAHDGLHIADDWLCEGGLVTDLHWWGHNEDDDQNNIGFEIGIYANDDMNDEPDVYSGPLWSVSAPFGSGPGEIRITDTGIINQAYGTPIYFYEYYLLEPFEQVEGEIYWLDLSAISEFPWMPPMWHWAGNFDPIILSEPVQWDIGYMEPLDLNMAFRITSEEPEPNDTKWIQNPDLDFTGIDVDTSIDFMGMSPWADHVLADDFNCTSTEAITDIHIWGSWYNDELPYGEPNNVFFLLTIHEDLPVGDPCNPFDYSIPGDILWVWGFGPEEFDVSIEAENISEGYYFPSEEDSYMPDADWTCFRYDFYIDPCVAFIQQGTPEDPCVYWLGVQAETESMVDLTRFGWKTSTDHWNDDAVWAEGDPWLHQPWQELRYPPGHPFMGESIDLAFSITTGTHEPNDFNEPNEPYTKPLAPHTKWSQPAIEIDPNSNEPNYCGWDEQSFTNDPDFEYGHEWRIVADDFRCLGTMPVTSIHWLGSFVGWEGDDPPPMEPIAWRIGFWSNIADPNPFNPETFSYPGELLWQIEADANQAGYSMISYWKFNENTGDEAGDSANGNDGTITGADWTTGKEGSALYFHGSGGGDVVTVPHSANLDITGPFTVEAWIKAEGTNKYHMIVDKYSGGPEYSANGFSFYLTDGNLRLSIYSGANGNGDVFSTQNLRDNKWHHVAALWGSGQGKLFVDGALAGQATWAFPPASTTNPLAIGQRPSGWGGFLPFLGTIDEVAIYDSALDPNEIKRHYEDGYAGPDYDVVKVGDYYQHSLYLEPNDYFWQDDYNDVTEDSTFWLSIAAVYPNDVDVDYPWGWHTRPWHWMDDAVTFVLIGPLEPGMTADQYFIEPLKDVHEESYDVVFELDTDPNYIKAEQLFTGIRDWPHYEDVMSRQKPGLPPLSYTFAADDWRCLRRTPVTAIAWWGSYIGYQYLPCSDPIMPKPVKPDYFMLSIYTDVPAGADPDYLFSHPGDMIWEYIAYEDDFDEVLVGFDKHPEFEEPYRAEPVFRYSVRLPEEDWFNQPDYNDIYWLAVQAVYTTTPDPYYDWGWTNHEHVFNDNAVQWYYDGGFKWRELLDQTGADADMSFMLFTDPDLCIYCADYNLSGLVEFKDYAVFALDWLWTGAAGGYANGDLDCNGEVNYEDLKIFTNQWLQSCP